jgi:hypothetical protein
MIGKGGNFNLLSVTRKVSSEHVFSRPAIE